MGRFLKHGQIEFVRMVVQKAYNNKKINKLQADRQFVRVIFLRERGKKARLFYITTINRHAGNKDFALKML